ncbi:hypothetical protein WICPIJ_005284 [Wickerhamomyces pijperi]|uniref:Secreted peptide n=1 Tax=Wickerhamomyces pijperi TaxID=599730 RepID=A0A9P8TM51_WICPI|nr:hypothetical protein WICPIJ_005284 [Wickerhamomyces pijperi]
MGSVTSMILQPVQVLLHCWSLLLFAGTPVVADAVGSAAVAAVVVMPVVAVVTPAVVAAVASVVEAAAVAVLAGFAAGC